MTGTTVEPKCANTRSPLFTVRALICNYCQCHLHRASTPTPYLASGSVLVLADAGSYTSARTTYTSLLLLSIESVGNYHFLSNTTAVFY